MINFTISFYLTCTREFLMMPIRMGSIMSLWWKNWNFFSIYELCSFERLCKFRRSNSRISVEPSSYIWMSSPGFSCPPFDINASGTSYSCPQNIDIHAISFTPAYSQFATSWRWHNTCSRQVHLLRTTIPPATTPYLLIKRMASW